MLFDDRVRARSFGDDPHQYDRSRPGYPSDLIDDLVEGATSALDVGCGTGRVARLLAGRGCDVLGVEQDERMAEVAREHGIAVEVAGFETWDPHGRTFDLLTSGQAWHWIEPTTGCTKAAQVLHRGGRFAVFWNRLIHPDDVMAVFVPIYGRLAPHLLEDSVALGTVRPDEAHDTRFLEQSGLFADIETRQYGWERRYTTEQWLDELPTHSAHRGLPPQVLDQLLVEVGSALATRGGEFVARYRTNAVVATAR